MDSINDKLEQLKQMIALDKKVLIAFSGGVDSTFLLKVAHQVLGDDTISVTVKSAVTPKREINEACEFARENRMLQLVVDFDPLEMDDFVKNPPERCYICKKQIFGKIVNLSKELDVNVVYDGSNADDTGDYRPGMKALDELSIKSPLKEVGLTKAEIRILSKQLGLYTAEKPSFACLATRIPYNDIITNEKLGMIEAAENVLFELGFKQVRVRVHGNLARIEIDEASFEKLLNSEVRYQINEKLKAIGYHFITFDIMGYQMGSLNVGLS